MILFMLASAQEVEDVPSHTVTVDTGPYVSALVSRFLACVAAEGTELPPSDQSDVSDALVVLAPILAFQGQASSCTATQAGADACAAWASGVACEGLHEAIEGVISGSIATAGTPSWAISYGEALGARVAECFAGEVGRAVTESETRDIQLFQNTLAGALAQAGASCPPRESNVATCVEDARGMDCAVLASYLVDEESAADTGSVEFDADLVPRLLGRCSGFLDCTGEEP